MHCIGRVAPVNVAPIAAPGAKRTAWRTAAARQLCRAGSSDEDGKDDDRERRPAQMPRRKLINLAAATTALLVSDKANANEFAGDAAMAIMNRVGKVRMSDDEWRAKLRDEPYAYEVLRHEATERPFSSPLNTEKRTGTFTCAGCDVPLFKSSAKYDSGTGWPSFVEPITPAAVTEVPDYSIIFLPRTEVRCANCQGHLGHVFDDGPRDRTGLRYCMNGVSLHFEPAADA